MGEQDSIGDDIFKQDRASEPVPQRFLEANIYDGLDLRFVGVSCKVLKTFSAYCGC